MFVHQGGYFFELPCSLFGTDGCGTLKKMIDSLGTCTARAKCGLVCETSGGRCVDREPIEEKFLHCRALVERKTEQCTAVACPVDGFNGGVRPFPFLLGIFPEILGAERMTDDPWQAAGHRNVMMAHFDLSGGQERLWEIFRAGS